MTGRREVRYVPDSFQLVAAGTKEPRHAGYTEREWIEARGRTLQVWQVAAGVLVLVALSVALVVLP